MRAYRLTEERLSRAKSAADRALDLDPGLPHAHLAMGYYYYRGQSDYEKALERFAIARAGLPSNTEIMEATGILQRSQGRITEAIETLERAVDLNPRDTRLLRELGLTHMLMRQYPNAASCWDRLISVAPDQTMAYHLKAWNDLLVGNTKGARSSLEAMPETDELANVWWWYLQLMMERKYQQALEWLSFTPIEVIPLGFAFYPKPLLSAQTHSFLNEPELAGADYDEARIVLEEELHQRPDDAFLHSALGLAYAGLGIKEEALREGELGAKLQPVSRDAFRGPWRKQELAFIYTQVGEYDAALDQIEELLSMPSWLSVAFLELDPWWDKLREHPRYQVMVEKYR
jgi:tetratricopeptide (TPR) repeat protein